MTRYKNTQGVELLFPSLNLAVKPGEEFEAEEDLTSLTGIVIVEEKKAAKKDAAESTETTEA